MNEGVVGKAGEQPWGTVSPKWKAFEKRLFFLSQGKPQFSERLLP